ncbi:hypothetical protein [Luteolibacter marinus]|uniref:hypothetical protein n=1 Tax=Luteolibacter marinus TaxID=2776705 RepID=UPI001867CA40|nr:hypothetical protein [Luteolibacter marinus]
MMVPEFWAEGRARHRTSERQVTVKRFGWSDASQDEAQAMAEERANEALQRILAGEPLPKNEPKMPYNGADGVPIREEILARHGDTIITRNSYGARCLNTPDVLFVDVDLATGMSIRYHLFSWSLMILLGIAFGWFHGSITRGLQAFGIAWIARALLGEPMAKLHARLTGSPRARIMRRIAAFSDGHPDWHLHIYETPAGYRILALHDVFDPTDDRVADCFKALGADPTYARMCRNQRCFRARVSPKPWRVGFARHLRPRPGVWPIDPARIPDREEWVAEYERRSVGHAACRFISRVGSERCHPAAEAVRTLHDDLSGANSGLPIA